MSARLDTFECVRSALGCLWRERMNSRGLIEEIRARRLTALLEHAKTSTVLGDERIVDPRAPLSSVRPITKDEMLTRFDDTIANRAISYEGVSTFVRDRDRV